MTFQSTIRAARRILPRGWSPVIATLARAVPALRRYPVSLNDGSTITLDLQRRMVHGYFFHGGQPHGDGILTVLRRTLHPGGVFVDVGANIGYYSLYASRLVGSSGAVLAYEPLPDAFAELARNAPPNVTVRRVAVGSRSGTIEFGVRDEADMSSFDIQGASSVLQVPLTTLDEALAELTRLDLLKIDVEGYEMEVLEGADTTIRRLRPTICFEYLAAFGAARGLPISAYLDWFSGRGYSCAWLNSTGRGQTLTQAEKSSDMLAIPM